MNVRHHRRAAVCAAALVACAVTLVFVANAPLAAKKPKAEDRFLHPKYSDFGVRTIAVLTPATFKPDDDAVTIARRSVERAVRPTGYRFLSAENFLFAARSAGVEAAARSLDESWKKKGTLDSAALATVGRARIADAVLATQMTTWERYVVEYNVAGQSFTQVAATMSLYSTATGERLWAGSFSERGDGPYNNAGGGESVIGVQGAGGLNPTARTSTSLDPPTFEEVTAKLEPKIRQGFPPMAAAAKAAEPVAPKSAADSASKR